MQKSIDSTFLISIAAAGGKKNLNEKIDKPFHSNLVPIEIRIQLSAKKKDPKIQKCKYIPNSKNDYSEDDRCYIQIWELDKWTEGKKKGKENDAAAKKSAKNDFLVEFGGFIKEINKGKFNFITDGKGTTFPKAPTDKKLGNLTIKIDHLQKDGTTIKKYITVPIQGEVESIFEIGVVYQDTANQQNYTDKYERPVYPIRNISKIIQEQLDKGGLNVICYTQHERDIDTKAHAFYADVKKQLLKPNTPQRRIKLGLPKDNSAPKMNLQSWLNLLDNAGEEYNGNLPDPMSTRPLYDIQNDRNFEYASGGLLKKYNSLYVNSENQIGVGRFVIIKGWQDIVSYIKKLITEIYKQYMNNQGEKPKILKLGIYCHGEPDRLKVGGREKNNTTSTDKYYGRMHQGDISASNLGNFVEAFIVSEGGKEQKLLTDNVLFALYACSTARSSFTSSDSYTGDNPPVLIKKSGPKVDNTFGKKPPAGKSLGEGSFARALRDELHKNNRFPQAAVYGHTTVGTADANPKIRLFHINKEKDLTKLGSQTPRDAMFTHPA